MAYASGSKAWGISDRSGRRYRLREMRKEWTGALVGPDEYESKQPQLLPHKAYPDPQALRNPRPEQVETKSKVLLQMNPFLVETVNSNVLTIIEPGHGRTTGERVRFSKAQTFQNFTQAILNRNEGFQITVTTTDEYTIKIEVVNPYIENAVEPYKSTMVSVGILNGSLGNQPELALFGVVVNGRVLADINNDGTGAGRPRGFSVRDALAYIKWHTGSAQEAAYNTYIEDVMNPYMFSNFNTYKTYLTRSTIANSRGGGGFVAAETLQNNASNVRVSGSVGTTVVGTVTIDTGNKLVNLTGTSATTAVGSVTVGLPARFDSTSITLDSTTDTFDEG